MASDHERPQGHEGPPLRRLPLDPPTQDPAPEPGDAPPAGQGSPLRVVRDSGTPERPPIPKPQHTERRVPPSKIGGPSLPERRVRTPLRPGEGLAPSPQAEPQEIALPPQSVEAPSGSPEPPPPAEGPRADAPGAPQVAKPHIPRKAPIAPPVQRSSPSNEIPVSETDAATLTSTTSSPRHKVEAWLAVMAKEKASDLILRAGGRPSIRVNGKIGFLPGRVPAAGPLLEVLEGVMGKQRMDMWRESGSADAGLQLDGLGRFRLNAYKQIGEPAVVIRRINQDAPSINGLNLPADDLKRLAMKKRGLILVTGIAGSGKSTTLSAMIEHMNETVERHVVTLEDPVELLFTEKRCVISQREVGTDCSSFQDGLRHALRQSPDAILIGEMRDAETVSAALDATETGHLVLSTLHTVNAPQTLERILSFFPAEQHKQVRGRLADNIAGVLSQRLVPNSEGKGLVPAYELLVSTPHIRELLSDGNTQEIARVIDSGTEKGLVSFNQCLRQLVLRQQVDLDDALAASDRPEELVLALRGITGSSAKVDTSAVRRGETGTDGLRMAGGSGE